MASEGRKVRVIGEGARGSKKSSMVVVVRHREECGISWSQLSRTQESEKQTSGGRGFLVRSQSGQTVRVPKKLGF